MLYSSLIGVIIVVSMCLSAFVFFAETVEASPGTPNIQVWGEQTIASSNPKVSMPGITRAKNGDLIATYTYASWSQQLDWVNISYRISSDNGTTLGV